MQIFDDLLRYRESETMTRVCSTSLISFIETIEDIGEIFFGDSSACVSHCESLRSYGYRDRPILRSEFLCIRYDIPDRREK